MEVCRQVVLTMDVSLQWNKVEQISVYESSIFFNIEQSFES